MNHELLCKASDFCDTNGSKKKHQKRLAALNVLHSNNLVEVSFGKPGWGECVPIRNHVDGEYPSTSSLHIKTHKISGRIVVSCNNDEKKKFSTPNCISATFNNSNKKLSTQGSNTLPNEPIRRSLRMKLMDVESMLRFEISSQDKIDLLYSDIKQLLEFLTIQLPSLARTYHVSEGTVLKELKKHCPRQGIPDSLALRSREGGCRQQLILPPNVISVTTEIVIKLLKLVRVKVEDDNDINLARSILNETFSMLNEIKTLAKEKRQDEYVFLKHIQK